MVVETEAKKPKFRALFLVFLALILPSCDETPAQKENRRSSQSNDVGFEAVITGSYEGKVSGSGVLMLLPEAGFDKQGYFFLADGQGVRGHGVTFVLPRGLVPGSHKLASPSPLKIGTVPSVRVDRDLENSVVSADKNTSGYLDLIAFPEDERSLSGSDVAGNFEFETKNLKGETITVKGSFSFKIK